MKNQPIYVKLIYCSYVILFLIGGLVHWRDILHGGVFPYKDIPFIFNFYLTSLAIFDFIVIVFLFAKPIYGIPGAVLIMATDLIIDFYVGYHYWDINLEVNFRLQSLVIVGLFIFISTPFLLKRIKE